MSHKTSDDRYGVSPHPGQINRNGLLINAFGFASATQNLATSASLRLSVNQTFAEDADPILWDVVEYEGIGKDTPYDPLTGIVTVGEGGTYEVSLHTLIQDITAASDSVGIILRLNGVALIESSAHYDAATPSVNQTMNTQVHRRLQLQAGDELLAEVRCDNQTCTIRGENNSWFQIHRVDATAI